MKATDPDKMTTDEVNEIVNDLDVQINLLREQKRKWAAVRAAKVAEAEFQAKVKRLTAEQKRRIVVKPQVADGVARAE